jgi:hypothetical protein
LPPHAPRIFCIATFGENDLASGDGEQGLEKRIEPVSFDNGSGIADL